MLAASQLAKSCFLTFIATLYFLSLYANEVALNPRPQILMAF
jgi:hypothetical protein